MLVLILAVLSHHSCVKGEDNRHYVTLVTSTAMVICLHYTIMCEIGMMQPIVIIELAPFKDGNIFM